MRDAKVNLFGGQAFTEPPKLCIDCEHRPARYMKDGGRDLPPCDLRPVLDAYDARQACKGQEWVPRGS
jgi:hypothetical protein